ncbi:unnamed protein product [Caenorhabditis auriculariae]|uniref:Uncharacterized protein n=1 Tax=Caenorhabditis auriculariae TaxID=2777116 RepID=A0A8S1H4E1_9PELO|nr:unnamed protein product [Caenorhabditis auriculariae]
MDYVQKVEAKNRKTLLPTLSAKRLDFYPKAGFTKNGPLLAETRSHPEGATRRRRSEPSCYDLGKYGDSDVALSAS